MLQDSVAGPEKSCQKAFLSGLQLACWFCISAVTPRRVRRNRFVQKAILLVFSEAVDPSGRLCSRFVGVYGRLEFVLHPLNDGRFSQPIRAISCIPDAFRYFRDLQCESPSVTPFYVPQAFLDDADGSNFLICK